MLLLQYHYGKLMCDLGWHGWSGLAEGSDTFYYEGAKQSLRFDEVGFTNVIPWNGFSSNKDSLIKHWHDPKKNIFALNFSRFQKRAMWLGLGARGGDFGLRQGGVKLHSRNSMQILGLELRYGVGFVHCWAKPKKPDGWHVDGGTGTAVALARHMKIPVINLATKDGLSRTLKFLKDNQVDLDYAHYENVLETYEI